MKSAKLWGIGLCLCLMFGGLMLGGAVLRLPRTTAFAQEAGQNPPSQPVPLSSAVQAYGAQFVERRDALNPFFPTALVNIVIPYFRTAQSGFDAITPPPGLEDAHFLLGSALDDCAYSAQFLTIGLENLSEGETRLVLEAVNRCAKKVADATDLLLQDGAPAAPPNRAP